MDLVPTSSSSAFSADSLALPGRLVTRLLFRAVMLDWLAAMLPSPLCLQAGQASGVAGHGGAVVR